MSARIVVAESDAALCQLAVSLLRQRGYQVIDAHEGRGALSLINVMQPDLVVLDLALPGLDGKALSGTLESCAQTAKLPTIMLTRKQDTAGLKEWLAGGAHDCLVKPFVRNELAAKVERMLTAVNGRLA
jgi:two-component system alkaline phosphatase synthesis response regulator PhoP